MEFTVYIRSLGVQSGSDALPLVYDYMDPGSRFKLKYEKVSADVVVSGTAGGEDGGGVQSSSGAARTMSSTRLKLDSSPQILGTTALSDSYFGCYYDCLGGRDLPAAKGKCTLAVCAQRCYGYKYWALQGGNAQNQGRGNCWCGMEVGKQGQVQPIAEADARCEAARSDAMQMKKCENCVYQLPMPDGGFLYEAPPPPTPPPMLEDQPLQQPCMPPTEPDMVLMGTGLSESATSSWKGFLGDGAVEGSWGIGNNVTMALEGSHECSDCINCVKVAGTEYEYQCDTRNAVIRAEMLGVWPMLILYKGGANVYAYTADQMKAPFLEWRQAPEALPCRISRKVIKGVVSEDGYSIQWEPKFTTLPGLTSTPSEGDDPAAPVTVVGAQGVAQDANGVYAYRGIKNGKPSYQNNFKYTITWLEDCQYCRSGLNNPSVKSAWIIWSGDAGGSGQLLFVCSGVYGCDDTKSSPGSDTSWQSVVPETGTGVQASQAGTAISYIKLHSGSADKCRTRFPDLLKHYYVGTPETGVSPELALHKCEVKCTQFGEKCSGFLLVSSGENKGHCYFRTGFIDVPTPAGDTLDDQLATTGQIYQRGYPNEFGDCYVKDPPPPGAAFIPTREYVKKSGEDCGSAERLGEVKQLTNELASETGSSAHVRSLLGSGHPAGSHSTNLGESAGSVTVIQDTAYESAGKCEEACNQMEGCTGFVRVEQDNQNNMEPCPVPETCMRNCTFLSNELQSTTNTHPDQRDCYIVDRKKAGLDRPELGSAMEETNKIPAVLAPVTAWARMCSVAYEDSAWSAYVEDQRAQLIKMKESAAAAIATDRAAWIAVKKKYAAAYVEDKNFAKAIRTPIAKEQRMKTHLEMPEKMKAVKELSAKEIDLEKQKILAKRTEDAEDEHKLLHRKYLDDSEREIKYEEERAQNITKVVKEGEAKEREKMVLAQQNISSRVDKEVSDFTRESVAISTYLKQHKRVFEYAADHNGLLQIPTSFAWVGNYEKSEVGLPDCRVKSVQGVATCATGSPLVGCLEGRLVSINCGCPGPFIYGASVRLQATDTYMNGKCPAVTPPPLKSSDEFRLRRIEEWLGVCVFETLKVQPPAPGSTCLDMLKARAQIEIAKQAVVKATEDVTRASDAQARASKKLTKAKEKAEAAATTADMSNLASQVSEASVMFEFVKSEVKRAEVKLKQAKHKLFKLSMTVPVTNSDVRDAQTSLKEAQLDRAMKESALAAAQSEARHMTTAFEKKRIEEEVWLLEDKLLASEKNELESEKHLAQMLNGMKEQSSKDDPPPPVSDPVQSRKEVISTYRNADELVAKSKISGEIEVKMNKLRSDSKTAQEKLEQTKLIEQKAEADFKEAKKFQETHGGSTRDVHNAEARFIHAQRDTFYGEEYVKKMETQMGALRIRTPLPPKVDTILAEGPQPTAIEAAMEEAADELKKASMNTALPPRIWNPPKATCAQGFAFVTGVCVKGPFVYAKCQLGPDSSEITVQAGCGCDGRFLHSIMVGHLQRQPEEKQRKASPRCVREFYKFSEAARTQFFTWQTQATCAGLIETECTRHHATVAQRQQSALRQKAALDVHMTSPLINNTISAYKMTIKEAEEREAMLRKKLATPTDWMQGLNYHKIPNIVLRANGELFKDYPFGKCRMHCSMNKKCKSMSWNRVDQECVTSSNTMLYDESFNCYLKKQTGYDETMTMKDGNFHMLPGMRMEPEGDGGEPETGYSLAECQFDCVNAEDCKAISYSAEKQLCIRSRTSLEYNEDWDYYEKGKASVKDQMFKERREKQWDTDVAVERKEKANAELSVIKQVVDFKTKSEELSMKSLATGRYLPQSDAEALTLQDKETSAAEVVLPVP